MAEKVVIQLTLDKKDFNKSLQTLAKDSEKAGKVSGKSFGDGFSESVERINTSRAGKIFEGLKNQIFSLKGAVASVFAGVTAGKAIGEAVRLENSFIGLRSVTQAFGGDVDRVTKAAEELAADGLIPLSDVTDSLKNLVANFNGDVEKSITVFEAFRDSAAFNRQGQLELGEAIRGASEGLKNDLSIKIDNAGVTKNLSNIVEDYAKSINKSVKNLTEAERAQAEYLGILKETSVFQGDYNSLLATFSGAISRVAGRFRFLLAELGKLITDSPVLIAGLQIVSDLLQQITVNVGLLNKAGINEFFQNGILFALAFSKAVNDFVIKPIKLLVDIVKTVFFALAGSAAALIDLIITPLTALEGFLQKAGFNFESFTKLSEGLQESLKANIDDYKKSLDDAGKSFNSLFGLESEDKYSQFIDSLVERLGDAIAKIDQFGGAVKKTRTEAEILADSVKQTGNAIRQTINQAITQTAVRGIQALTRSLILGEKGFQNFGKQVAGILGDLSTQLGQTLILTGVGMLALGPEGGFSPTQAIAAGAGLVALGQILKSFSGGQGAESGAVGAGTAIQDSASSSFDTDIEREEPNTEVTVNIQGDILDSDETGARIVNLINDSFDKQGVVINRGVIG